MKLIEESILLMSPTNGIRHVCTCMLERNACTPLSDMLSIPIQIMMFLKLCSISLSFAPIHDCSFLMILRLNLMLMHV